MVKTDVKERVFPGFENIRPYTSGASAISSVDWMRTHLPAPCPCLPRVPVRSVSLATRTQVSPSYDEPLGSCKTQQMCSWACKMSYLLFDYLILWLRQCDHSVVSPFEKQATVRTLLSGPFVTAFAHHTQRDPCTSILAVPCGDVGHPG